MLFKKLKVAGLLSFGPEGVDLPLRDLNVFIGPNGSGKSNFLEILALLKAAPRNLPDPIKKMGGMKEWLWKGEGAVAEGTIEALVNTPMTALRHYLAMSENGGRFEVTNESIEDETADTGKTQPYVYYNFRHGDPILTDLLEGQRVLPRGQIRPDESILSQIKDPGLYPALTHLQDKYAQIRLFRNWSFGPGALLRKEQNTSGRSDFLSDGGENLALVLSGIKTGIRKQLLTGLEQLYPGIIHLDVQIYQGGAQLFLEEEGGRLIPASRLSDGTLRYLCLLAILLHPEPPPLVAIEEPELGLHPDVIPHVATLLMEASHRMQLVVTTHSQMLVEALGEHPESVVVCERHEGISRFKRLNASQLKEWFPAKVEAASHHAKQLFERLRNR
jgi:predicted ATPase